MFPEPHKNRGSKRKNISEAANDRLKEMFSQEYELYYYLIQRLSNQHSKLSSDISFLPQWKSLYVITFGPEIFDHINRMITISTFQIVLCEIRLMWSPSIFDHITEL